MSSFEKGELVLRDDRAGFFSFVEALPLGGVRVNPCGLVVQRKHIHKLPYTLNPGAVVAFDDSVQTISAIEQPPRYAACLPSLEFQNTDREGFTRTFYVSPSSVSLYPGDRKATRL